MDAWFNEYVGIPYRAGGRDRTGCDCWGLVRLVLQEHYKKSIPSFEESISGSAEESMRLFDIYRPLVDVFTPDIPKEGDIVMLKIRNIPSHVGIYLGNGLMLHTLIQHDSAIDRVDSPRWAKRIEGFYRVK